MVRRLKESGTVASKSPGPMNSREFETLGRYIQSSLGIKMPPGKKTMLESRLNKRLRSLGMKSFKEYGDYLFSLKGREAETPHLIDVVTTNKTEFFRERNHFDILSREILPRWVNRNRRGKTFAAWSAGCSSGEEVYTLAMVLADFAETRKDFRFQILGTDISQAILQKARRAVYPERLVHTVPGPFQRKYLMRSKDRSQKLVRVVPELRSRVAFREINLMDNFSFRENMDIIFCRNVIIYFEREVQEVLFRKLSNCLNKDGHIFIGHSETLNGMDLPLEQLRPTLYRKTDDGNRGVANKGDG